MKHLLTTLALCLCLSPSVWGATYYVATTGNDTTGDGSVGNPWRNPQRCTKSPIAPGDTCIVKSGTYTSTDSGIAGHVMLITASQSSIAGTAANPITIKSETPLAAHLRVPTRNAASHAIYISREYWIIEGFDIDGTGTTYDLGSSASHSGITVAGNNNTIRKNRFHDIARTQCSNSAFGNAGMFLNNNVTNTLVEQNQFDKIGRLRNGESGCVTTISQHDHGIYSAGADNSTIRRNIFWDTNRGYAITFFVSGGTHSNINVYNNTFSGKSPTNLPAGQVNLSNIVTNVNIKNNIFHDSPLGYGIVWSPSSTASNVVITHAIQNGATSVLQNPSSKPASGITESNILYGQTLGLTNTGVGTENFTLTSASAAINAGTDVGLPFNGSAPDMGAFETLAFSSCAVESGSTTIIHTNWTNNVFPPLLPSSGHTGFIARKNAVSNVITTTAQPTDNAIYLTVTNAYINGDTIDFSLGATNLTDSSLIGGTLNQPVFAVTNQSCANNVAGVTFTFTQAVARIHAYDGAESAPRIKPSGATGAAAENVSRVTWIVGGYARIRFAVTCTIADCPATSFVLRASRNGGSYTNVPSAFSTDNIAFCGVPASSNISSGVPTTKQTTVSGPFTAGAVVFTNNAIPSIDLPLDGMTEVEYCVKNDTDTAPDDTFDFRLVRDDASVLIYTFTPRLTVIAPQSGRS